MGKKIKHLRQISDLTDEDITTLFEKAMRFSAYLRDKTPAPQSLAGRTQINLFFEDSTRTNLSFDLAGKKLGADVINVPVAASSVNKNEEMIDTVQTLSAMGADVMIVRAKEPGIHQMLADRIPCPLINAGDGTHEHPTQALLDAVTILATLGPLKNKTIAICGDIKHSRVAGSGIHLFQRLGATVHLVGPETLLPDPAHYPDADQFTTLKDGLAGCDIVMGLRMQFERMAKNDATTNAQRAEAYFNAYGLTHETLKLAKPGAKIMHPGPMNRGIEIDGALADDPEKSLVLSQVFHGVALRMAVLEHFALTAHSTNPGSIAGEPL